MLRHESNWSLARVVRKIENLGHFILNLNYGAFAILLMAISLLKSGVRGIQPWANLEVIEKFPSLTPGYSQTSLGLLALSKVLAIDTKFEFFIFNIILLSIFTFVLSKGLRNYLSDFESRLYLMILFFSPLYVVLLGNIGRHDILTISGLILVVVANTKAKTSLGLLVALFGSPEHTIATLFLLLCTAWIFKINMQIRKYVLSIAMSCIYLLFILMYLRRDADEISNRFTSVLFDKQIQKEALSNFLRNAPLELFSYFGVLLFLLIPFLLGLERLQRFGVFAILVVPALANILILDKTRDYVVAVIPILFLIFRICDVKSKLEVIFDKYHVGKSLVLGVALLTCIIVPSIELTFEGSVRAPYEWILSKAGILSFIE